MTSIFQLGKTTGLKNIFKTLSKVVYINDTFLKFDESGLTIYNTLPEVAFNIQLEKYPMFTRYNLEKSFTILVNVRTLEKIFNSFTDYDTVVISYSDAGDLIIENLNQPKIKYYVPFTTQTPVMPLDFDSGVELRCDTKQMRDTLNKIKNVISDATLIIKDNKFMLHFLDDVGFQVEVLFNDVLLDSDSELSSRFYIKQLINAFNIMGQNVSLFLTNEGPLCIKYDALDFKMMYLIAPKKED